jgi:hypothetical protein
LRVIFQRLVDMGSGFVEIFVRNNRVLPPVVALLALFVFAWILAGAFMGESGQEPFAPRADLAQANVEPSPEIENRDVDSYAAYRSKDPFRQLLAPAEAPSEQTSPETTQQTTPEDTTGTGTPPGTSPGNGAGATDSDGDGLADRRERALGLDPRDPDTDKDGTPDGADDSNGDGRPDAGAGSTPGGKNGDSPGTGRGDSRRPGRGDDLLDSGGILYPR